MIITEQRKTTPQNTIQVPEKQVAADQVHKAIRSINVFKPFKTIMAAKKKITHYIYAHVSSYLMRTLMN